MLKYPVLALLWFYKRVCSPLLPPACRYEPTCSVYMAIAVRHRGAIVGVWLGIRRLLRCHPFGSHGWDPVPGVDEALQRPHVTPGSPYATSEPESAPSPAAAPPTDTPSAP